MCDTCTISRAFERMYETIATRTCTCRDAYNARAPVHVRILLYASARARAHARALWRQLQRSSSAAVTQTYILPHNCTSARVVLKNESIERNRLYGHTIAHAIARYRLYSKHMQWATKRACIRRGAARRARGTRRAPAAAGPEVDQRRPAGRCSRAGAIRTPPRPSHDGAMQDRGRCSLRRLLLRPDDKAVARKD